MIVMPGNCFLSSSCKGLLDWQCEQLGRVPTWQVHHHCLLFISEKIRGFLSGLVQHSSGAETKKLRKFWITIEGSDTFEDVAVVKLIFPPCELKFLPNKLWKSIWEFLIDDPVKFLGAQK